jgi:serine/threonine protein kinase
MECPLDLIYKEIYIQLKFNHPNITRLFSFHEDKENIYMILEYSNNGNLFSKIRFQKFLSEDEAFMYFIQVVNAINFLHENGYIHRDIKPENILLDRNNNVKLCDFGWCTKISENQKRKTFCGTIEYMSPEIISNENYDKCVDIWALGILLYEMLHGFSPFKSKNVKLNYEQLKEEIFNNIENGSYVIYKEKELSKECVSLIRKLLEKNDEERINVKEIFPQPWVRKYEKIKKKELIKFYNERKKKEKEKEKEDNDNLILFHNKIDNNNISHIEINSSLDDRFFDDSKFIDYSFLREIEEIREKEKEDRKKNQNNDLIDALQIFDNVDEKMKENKTKIVNRPKKSFFENLFQNFCCELNQ